MDDGKHTANLSYQHDASGYVLVDEHGNSVGSAYDQTVRDGRSITSLANVALWSASPSLLALATQYRDDMRHSLSAESRARRLELIESVIAKATKATP